MNEWDSFYMEIAEKMATKSKCSAKHVGCLLVKDNNILSVGINGTFPSATNCCDIFRKENGVWKKRNPNTGEYIGNMFNVETGYHEPVFQPEWIRCEDQEEHFKWSLVHEVHAEMNALAKANKNGVSVEGSTAYVTHSPCYNCAKNLYTFGIKKIFFRNAYDDIDEVRELLKDFDIQIIYIPEGE
jgi:dCMP deaminase